jgi:hypothetical protein
MAMMEEQLATIDRGGNQKVATTRNLLDAGDLQDVGKSEPRRRHRLRWRRLHAGRFEEWRWGELVS